MKTLIALLLLPGILLVCVVGCAAALCRMKRLDDWCARQLTDTDQSEAEMEVPRRLPVSREDQDVGEKFAVMRERLDHLRQPTVQCLAAATNLPAASAAKPDDTMPAGFAKSPIGNRKS